MLINSATKISSLLKQHPDALEAIVALSPKFTALRNPVLRKLMAGRTSIATAAKMGGCRVADFYEKLIPLGFSVDDNESEEVTTTLTTRPFFLQQLNPDALVCLDVRPIIDAGKDPLAQIQEKINTLKPQQVLHIINSFEPSPLIKLLAKQGFESFVESPEPELVHSYFYRSVPATKDSRDSGLSNTPAASGTSNSDSEFEQMLEHFKGCIDCIDVRVHPMPLPMQIILLRLEKLLETHALFVFHKRIPVYLLPELADRNLNYLVRHINDSELHLLIYHASAV